MSAGIKRYSLDGFNNDLVADADGFLVDYSDHLASHALDEAVERAAFEAWSITVTTVAHERRGDSYADFYVAVMWSAWLACAKSRAKRFGGAE